MQSSDVILGTGFGVALTSSSGRSKNTLGVEHCLWIYSNNGASQDTFHHTVRSTSGDHTVKSNLDVFTECCSMTMTISAEKSADDVTPVDTLFSVCLVAVQSVQNGMNRTFQGLRVTSPNTVPQRGSKKKTLLLFFP